MKIQAVSDVGERQSGAGQVKSGPATVNRAIFWEPSLAFMKIAVAGTLVASLAFELILLLFAPEQRLRMLGAMTYPVVAGVAWFLLARGKVQSTVCILIAGLWMSVTVTSFLFGGVNSTTIIVYPLLIIFAGWMSGTRIATAMALLTATVTLGFVIGDALGWLPGPTPTPQSLRWLIQLCVFIITAILITYFVRFYRNRLLEVRKLGDDLARRSAELLVIEADLNRAQAVAHVGSWVYDIPQDVTRLSAETCRIYGLPPATVGNYASSLSRVHPQDRDAVNKAWRVAISGGAPYDIEHRILVGDSVRWVRQKTILECDAGGVPVRAIGTAQDITEQKQVADELRAQTERLQIGQATAQLVVVDWDIRNDIISWSDSPEWLRGPLPASGKYPVYKDQIHPDDREYFLAQRTKSMETLVGQALDYRVVRTDGEIRWVHCRPMVFPGADGKAARMVIALLDITARKATEAELRKSTAFRELLLEAIPVPVFHKDNSGRYRGCNSAFIDFIGKPRSEIVGKSVFEVSSQGLAQNYRDKDLDLLEGPTATQVYESRVRHADGSEHDVIFHKARMSDDTGAPTGIIGVITDITEIKRVEAVRDELEAKLREARKMEALGTLAGGIAHDFNNILAAIRGSVQLAKAELPGHGVAVRSLEQIEKSAARAIELVRQILTFSRGQQNVRTAQDLSAAVEEAVQILRAAVPPAIVIHTRFQPRLPAVQTSFIAVHQLVMNLGVNAAHAMDNTGRIDIEVDAAEVGSMLAEQVPGLKPGRYLRLVVRDSGRGMDRMTMTRIFEPFYSTKGPDTGAGLGLSVVYGIVKEHGGAVDVESAPGRGTGFTIYFPVTAEVAQQPAAVVQPASGATRGNGERLLFVDDEEELVLLSQLLLEKMGYRVHTAMSGEEALATFLRSPYAFDAMITDVAMPGMSGLDLAHGVLAVRPRFPIIIMSGHIRDADAQRAQTLGLGEIHWKPNTVGDLAETLRQRLQRAPVSN
jgi:PAS domain S-box-containing protein